MPVDGCGRQVVMTWGTMMMDEAASLNVRDKLKEGVRVNLSRATTVVNRDQQNTERRDNRNYLPAEPVPNRQHPSQHR